MNKNVYQPKIRTIMQFSITKVATGSLLSLTQGLKTIMVFLLGARVKTMIQGRISTTTVEQCKMQA